MKSKGIGIVIFLLSLTGCNNDTPLPSNSVTTTEIFPAIKSVQYEDGSVLTTVELHNFLGDYLYLSSGDNLLSSLDVPPEQLTGFSDNLFANAQVLSNRVNVLQERNLFTNYILFYTVIDGSPEYYALDNTDGLSLPIRSYVTLQRLNHQSATNSWVELPPAFSIMTPDPYSSISRSGTLTLSWSNFDNVSIMKLDVGAVCDGIRYPASLNLGIVNTGSIVLNTADYFPIAPPPTSNCSVSFLLNRQKLGFISPDFGGGSFEGIQQRTIQFTSTP